MICPQCKRERVSFVVSQGPQGELEQCSACFIGELKRPAAKRGLPPDQARSRLGLGRTLAQKMQLMNVEFEEVASD